MVYDHFWEFAKSALEKIILRDVIKMFVFEYVEIERKYFADVSMSFVSKLLLWILGICTAVSREGV